MELKTKKLELEENEQIIDMLKDGATEKFKKEKAALDRESKKDIKKMEVLSKVGIEELKQDSLDDREGLDALVRMAIEQSKEEN